ncbi:MAG: hypothetical protein KDB27_34955 [Planctomycetales bacterium]|nr:hypothetical protein [Planctomycetales bacterium]
MTAATSPGGPTSADDEPAAPRKYRKIDGGVFTDLLAESSNTSTEGLRQSGLSRNGSLVTRSEQQDVRVAD